MWGLGFWGWFRIDLEFISGLKFLSLGLFGVQGLVFRLYG